MDESTTKPETTEEENATKVNVTVGGASSPPAAPAPATEEPETPESPAPATTFEPESSDEPEAEPELKPAPAPSPTDVPAPEAQSSADAGSTPPPPAQPVVTSSKGGGKRWLKVLLFLIIVAALAAGGWYAWQKRSDNGTKTAATTQSKDVPLLRIGFLQPDFGSLYPDMSVNDYGYSINAQMFEGLVRYEDKSKIVPDLATDWTNPDSKTWNFTIKKGVKFHDGNTLTAQDVKYSLDKVIASKSDLADTFAGTIAAVSVVNNDQVKITTTAPDPTLLNKLTFLYIIDANAPKGSEPSQAGTGPYEIKPGTKPSDKSVQMVAFDGYHDGKPTTRALQFSGIDNPASLVKDFQADKYDMVGYVDPTKGAAVQSASRFTTTASDVNYIGFNTVKAGPLQKKLVREAIRYAVDPEAIGKARGSEVSPLSQMIPKTIPGYNPAIPTYKPDIAKAKQLLAQAGYPNGLTLRFSASSDGAASTAEISSELKKAGITLTVDAHTDFDEFINYFNSGKADMYTIDYSSDTLDGLDIYTTTLPDTNYNNPKLTALLDQAGTTVDPAKRLKLLQDAAVIIDQDVAAVPLSTENDLWLMNKNYAIKQDLPSSYLPVYFYKVQLK